MGGSREAGFNGDAVERAPATMRSSIGWALLGLVIQRPSYGYELVQRFERIYGDSLDLSSPSQIYTALDALQRRSLVERIAPEQAGGPGRQPKPHYRATANGVLGYREWLVEQCRQQRSRSRMFALQLAMLSPRHALAVLDRYEQTCLAAAREASVERPRPDRDESASGLAERLALEDDRLTLDGRLAWIQYARVQFEKPASAVGKLRADFPSAKTQQLSPAERRTRFESPRRSGEERP